MHFKVCSSMKVSLLYISIIYELIIILFHLQMMPTISLAALQEVVSDTISTKWHSNVIIVYNITIQWPNNNIHYYLLTHYAYATSIFSFHVIIMNIIIINIKAIV